MKPSILVLAPRPPLDPTERFDERLFWLLEAMARDYAVHFIYFQSLFVDADVLGRLTERGITSEYFRDLLKDKSATVASVLKLADYSMVYIGNYYAAKYILPHIMTPDLKTPIIIDTVKSSYLYELSAASAEKDFHEAQRRLRSAQDASVQELAVYCEGTLLLSSSLEDTLELGKKMQGIPIVTVPLVKEAEIRPESVRGELMKQLGAVASAPASPAPSVACSVAVLPYASPELTVQIASDQVLGFVNVDASAAKQVTRFDRGSPSGTLSIAQVNAALRQMKTPYGLIMTDDAFLPEYAVDHLTRCLDRYREVGLATLHSNYVHPNTTKIQDLHVYFQRHFLTNFRNWRSIVKTNEPMFMVRTEVIGHVGLLDESYKSIYYALFDYMLRVTQAGYVGVFCSEVYVFHRQVMSEPGDWRASDRRILREKWAHEGSSFLDKIDPADN